MTTYTNYQNADAHGLPAFETIDDYQNQFLLAQNEPGLQQPVRILLADSLTLAQFTVVGLDANGKLTPAVWHASTPIRPIGVLASAASSGATNTTKFGEVFLEGSFNTDADSPLVWDASFNSVARKQQYNTANSRLRFVSRKSTATI